MTVLFCNGGVKYHFESGRFHARSAEREVHPDKRIWSKRERRRAMSLLFDPGERKVKRGRNRDAVESE